MNEKKEKVVSSEKVIKSKFEYTTHSVNSKPVLGEVRSGDEIFYFLIKGNSIFFQLRNPKSINLEELLEENEGFSIEKGFSSISYDLPRPFVRLCSHGGITNDNTKLEEALKKRKYNLIKLGNISTYGVKNLK